MKSDELLAVIAAKRVTQTRLCEAMGLNRSTFYRKLYGGSEFTRSEISIMAHELKLSNDDIIRIFFS